MKKLAVCVPTKDHADIVEQILLYSAGYLKDNGVDIYYYDSSENEKTRDLIKGLNKKGFYNVYYINVSSDKSYGRKIDRIFSGYGLKDEYEYIWPMKDRTICNEEMLKILLARIDHRADVVISLSFGNIFEGDYIDVDSPADMYGTFAKQTTSLETVIYNMTTVLKGYRSGFAGSVPKYQDDFWHYHYLYNRLADMTDTVISVVSKEGACNVISSITPESFWHRSFLEVWIEEWIQLNYELPEIYSPHKLRVIKETTSIGELLGDKEVFVKLHNEGILTGETYQKYADMWEYVTNVPVEEIEKIALGK